MKHDAIPSRLAQLAVQQSCLRTKFQSLPTRASRSDPHLSEGHQERVKQNVHGSLQDLRIGTWNLRQCLRVSC